MPKTANSPKLKPFIKYVGGKGRLLPELFKYVPSSFGDYYEPFVGAGALFFGLQPNTGNVILNDINAELINCYQVIRDNLPGLINELKKHTNDEWYYYSVRDWDRRWDWKYRSPEERAARLIYLNKCCYGGVLRVNLQNQINVPFGFYNDPLFLDIPTLTVANEYLNSFHATGKSTLQISNKDFAEVIETATEGDFAYFDPPYYPVSDTADFTAYNADGFDGEDQERLKSVIDGLTKKNVSCLISNSSTEFIWDLYQDYTIVEIKANRAINSDTTKRGKVSEVLIMNY